MSLMWPYQAEVMCKEKEHKDRECSVQLAQMSRQAVHASPLSYVKTQCTSDR